MAAQAWKPYNRFKKQLGIGGIALIAGSWRILLVTSASNFATATLALLGSLTNEVASGNGYSSSGKALASLTYTAGASAAQMRWDAADTIWTATGGNIANIKGAVLVQIGASAGARFMGWYCSLTSSQFTLSTGNTLTIQEPATGISNLV